jgi:hypothetical protein
MGDTSIAQDLIDGVVDALGDLGATRTVRIISEGSLDINDPGAGKPRTSEEFSVEALLYYQEEKYIENTVVFSGLRKAIISIEPLSVAQLAGIKQGAKFIVDGGSEIYTIDTVERIEVAGIVVTVIANLQGAS